MGIFLIKYTSLARNRLLLHYKNFSSFIVFHFINAGVKQLTF
jgi:hypothetical protein